jgi:hypothetical protein
MEAVINVMITFLDKQMMQLVSLHVQADFMEIKTKQRVNYAIQVVKLVKMEQNQIVNHVLKDYLY